jgi:hypothetical protein
VAVMTKEQVVEKIKKMLKMDNDLSFLLQLTLEDLETLIATIKERVEIVISRFHFHLGYT